MGTYVCVCVGECLFSHKSTSQCQRHTWSVISWGTKRHLRGGGKRGLVGRGP